MPIGTRVTKPDRAIWRHEGPARDGRRRPLRAFTPLARRLLAIAGDEAQRMGAADVRTVHLVYALVNEPEGLAMLVLTMMGVDPTEVATAIDAAAPAPIVDCLGTSRSQPSRTRYCASRSKKPWRCTTKKLGAGTFFLASSTLPQLTARGRLQARVSQASRPAQC
jgi:ATP-dependent Clp protease ATP-binding subunit ClpA